MTPFFVVNPKAGGGTALAVFDKVKAYLEQENIPYSFHITTDRGDATLATQRACEEEYTLIIAVGGDGTINEVVNGFDDFSKRVLAVIPAGTGNDFAYPVGIPKEPIAALKLALSLADKPTNLMQAAGRYAVSFVTAGIDIAIVNMVNSLKHKRKNSYNLMTAKAMLSYSGDMMTITNTDTGYRFCDKACVMAFSNTGSISSGVRLSQRATVDNDGLAMLVLPFATRLKLLAAMLSYLKGRLESYKLTQSERVQRVTVQFEALRTLNVDGELISVDGEFEVRLWRGMLRCIRQ